mmetsp:Transcript_12674/g.21325  ORF Transcript_12674/g.21325 Transcript_12674/m.21325 type:complete len:124 (-) Transcript_12674:85-456(-)
MQAIENLDISNQSTSQLIRDRTPDSQAMEEASRKQSGSQKPILKKNSKSKGSNFSQVPRPQTSQQRMMGSNLGRSGLNMTMQSQQSLSVGQGVRLQGSSEIPRKAGGSQQPLNPPRSQSAQRN